MPLQSEFSHLFNDDQRIYLDNAATTQKPKRVIDAICHFYQTQNANVHRSSHRTASQATDKYESARQAVANFIHAKNVNDIVWTKGTTESINLVAYAWGEAQIQEGDIIVVLGSEHHANFVPWQQLALRKGARFEVVNLDAYGNVDRDHYRQLMSLRPKFVALQHVSNALGNIHPIEDLVHLAKQAGAITLVDGAQAVAHIEVNVQEIGCDFYAFSGHKMYGPTGIGVIYINETVKDQMRPFHFGGEMIQSVSKEQTLFRPLPYLLETGTPNISGVLGLNAAIEFMSLKAFKRQQEFEQETYLYLVHQLKKLDRVKILGDTQNNIGVVSFVIDGESVGDIGTLLDEQGISVRCGHHCAMPLMAALGVQGTVRASLAVYNDKSDVDAFIEALSKTLALLEE